jgi:hypothetical protein
MKTTPTFASLFAILAAACAVACGSAPSASDGVGGTSDLEAATPVAACTDATRDQIWANMVKQPIKPARFGAGLDIAGGDAFPGISEEAVADAFCAGTAPSQGDDGDDYIAWGNAAPGTDGPVELGFDHTTHRANVITFNAGYEGSVDFQSRPGGNFGTHTYSIKVGSPILRDGIPFVIDWSNSATATELNDALAFTFAPALNPDDIDCKKSQRCMFAVTDDEPNAGIYGSRDVHLYVHVPLPAASPATATVPDYLYMFPEVVGAAE